MNLDAMLPPHPSFVVSVLIQRGWRVFLGGGVCIRLHCPSYTKAFSLSNTHHESLRKVTCTLDRTEQEQEQDTGPYVRGEQKNGHRNNALTIVQFCGNIDMRTEAQIYRK